jgi:hypothetical protein
VRLQVKAEVTEYYFLTGCDTVQFRSIFRIEADIILQDKINYRTGTGTTEEQTLNDGIEWGRGSLGLEVYE